MKLVYPMLKCLTTYKIYDTIRIQSIMYLMRKKAMLMLLNINGSASVEGSALHPTAKRIGSLRNLNSDTEQVNTKGLDYRG